MNNLRKKLYCESQYSADVNSSLGKKYSISKEFLIRRITDYISTIESHSKKLSRKYLFVQGDTLVFSNT